VVLQVVLHAGPLSPGEGHYRGCCRGRDVALEVAGGKGLISPLYRAI
jgi:hypothetical protein